MNDPTLKYFTLICTKCFRTVNSSWRDNNKEYICDICIRKAKDLESHNCCCRACKLTVYRICGKFNCVRDIKQLIWNLVKGSSSILNDNCKFVKWYDPIFKHWIFQNPKLHKSYMDFHEKGTCANLKKNSKCPGCKLAVLPKKYAETLSKDINGIIESQFKLNKCKK